MNLAFALVVVCLVDWVNCRSIKPPNLTVSIERAGQASGNGLIAEIRLTNSARRAVYEHLAIEGFADGHWQRVIGDVREPYGKFNQFVFLASHRTHRLRFTRMDKMLPSTHWHPQQIRVRLDYATSPVTLFKKPAVCSLYSNDLLPQMQAMEQ